MNGLVNDLAGQNAHVVEREVRASARVVEVREANDIVAAVWVVGCSDGIDVFVSVFAV